MAFVTANPQVFAESPVTPRVATVDWAQAETLTALGVPPVGIGQLDAYRSWVDDGDLPDMTRNIGLRVQPNMELLAQMKLDLVTLSPMFEANKARLSKIAPVREISIYYRDGPLWPNLEAGTRELGAAVGRADAAERLIARSNAHLAELAGRVPADTPPLLLVQFLDARHLRVFGGRGLYQSVLDKLGLKNAWTGTTSFWGYAQVSLERLGELSTPGEAPQIVIINPMPVGVAGSLEHNVLWARIPAVKTHPVLTLPPAWSFGGLPSAIRFADNLLEVLAHGDASAGAGS
ncbi:ABC transporter substrate-binding protein [Salinisphaera aquimarina]